MTDGILGKPRFESKFFFSIAAVRDSGRINARIGRPPLVLPFVTLEKFTDDKNRTRITVDTPLELIVERAKLRSI